MGKKLSVAIVYGFAEGNWHGRGLRKVLLQKGFNVSRDPKTADIIIGHSAGCYLIPQDTQAKLILHSGYTYWPGRRLLNSLSENLRAERQQHGLVKWLARCTINDFYMLNVLQTARMLRGWHDPGLFLDQLPKARHIFVRPQHDSYCEPNELLARTGQNMTYVSTAGGNHNDIWDNPQTYVDLLQSVV